MSYIRIAAVDCLLETQREVQCKIHSQPEKHNYEHQRQSVVFTNGEHGVGRGPDDANSQHDEGGGDYLAGTHAYQ